MIVVLGKGESGAGAVELLERLGLEYVWQSPNQPLPNNIDYVVLSPGIPPHHNAVQELNRRGVRIISEVEFAYSHSEGQVIAVTGTNGKSTTTALIHHILTSEGYNSRLCGNIGTAFSRISAAGTDFSDVISLETSSFQLENIETFRPHIALLLNITPDHLDHHKTMDGYMRAKFNLTLNQTESDYLILSADSIDCAFLRLLDSRAKILFFSTKARVAGTYVFCNTIYFEGREVMPVSSVPLLGMHNVSNTLAAITACAAFGMELPSIARAIRTFKPLEHRLQLVKETDGTTYINDSKATNIDAALLGARALEGSTALLVGGSDKGYEFDELFARLPSTVSHIIAYGDTAEKIVSAAKRHCYQSYTRVQNLAEAVSAAQTLNTKYVLLAPACASFDQYKNYEERGRHFVQLVESIGKEKANPPTQQEAEKANQSCPQQVKGEDANS